MCLFLSCLIFINGDSCSEVKTFSVTVNRVMGDDDSKDDLRNMATLEAKRRVLELAGTYLQTATVIRDYKLKSDEVVAIAAGVLSTNQSQENLRLEGESIIFVLTYDITIDLEEIDRRIDEFLKNKVRVDDFKRMQEDYTRILAENEKLRKQMLSANSEEKIEIKQQQDELNNELSSAELFEKAYSETDLNSQIILYTELLELSPNDKYALNNRAYAFHMIGNFPSAISDFTKAIEIDPEFLQAYFNRALALENLGEYQAAISDFTFIMERNPDYNKAAYSRGRIFNIIQDYPNAIRDGGLAIANSPGDKDCYILRGNAYYYSEKYDSAVIDYTMTINLDPDNFENYHSRANAYYMAGRYEPAIKDYSKSIELNPEQNDLYYFRGHCYHLLKDNVSAKIDFEKLWIWGMNRRGNGWNY